MRSLDRRRMVLFVVLLLGGAVYPLYAQSGEDKPAKKEGKPEVHRVVELDLSGRIVEQPGAPVRLSFPPRRREMSSLHHVLSGLQKAETDPSVKGLLIRMDRPRMGRSMAQDLVEAIRSFREAGKFTYVHADDYSGTACYLASPSDHVTIDPTGSVYLLGVRAQAMYFKEMLDRIGVKPVFIAKGKYKTAPEAFTRKGSSDAHRTMIEDIIDRFYDNLVTTIARNRDVDEETVRSWIEHGIYSAENAQEAGLVDEMGYEKTVRDRIEDRLDGRVVFDDEYGDPETDRPDLSSLTGLMSWWSKLMSPPEDDADDHPRIALLYASGTIMSGERSSPNRRVAAGAFTDLVDRLRTDDRVKAVVLRVNSPGGQGGASDRIWHALRTLRKAKPVIVSMGDYAASGGYYIAAAGDTIFARKTTLTGSIGVFGGLVNARPMLDKLGIQVETFSKGPHATLGLPFSKPTDADVRLIREQITRFYRTFLKRVSVGRGMTEQAVHEAAQGRVWTGAQAREQGLVDRLGGLREALSFARETADLPADLPVEVYPEKQSYGEALRQALGLSSQLRRMGADLLKQHGFTRRMLNLVRLFRGDHVLTVLPYRLRFRY